MNFSLAQEQIAKELCLAVLERKQSLSTVDRHTMDDSEYIAMIGEQVGILYQSILKKVAETNDID